MRALVLNVSRENAQDEGWVLLDVRPPNEVKKVGRIGPDDQVRIALATGQTNRSWGTEPTVIQQVVLPLK